MRLARIRSGDEIGYTAFTRPVLDDHRAIAFARLPHAKPDASLQHRAPTDVPRQPGRARLCATDAGHHRTLRRRHGAAPASSRTTASIARARGPIRDDVLGWLDGRALGQFAPGQHVWVQNPLPASVFQKKQQKCLAEGIYFEARGEPEAGQAAVAQVILNRVRNPAYPDTICGVVYQNKSWRNRCQFSFACDGRSEVIAERASGTRRAHRRDVTDGRIWIAEVGDSTHYYANYVRPGWARRMIKVDTNRRALFYRTRFGGWS